MSQKIGRYDILETLGKGGMGVVYRARDPELHRDVAIKVVLSWAQYDEEALARFHREARVVAQLQHPHIVTVFDAGRTEDGLPYFVMEYLEGTDLGELIGLKGSLMPAHAVRYMLQVCEGLSYAHARDIVHRDIKPANLLITPEDTIKIVDFGIAKLVGAQITGTGVSLGTPLYMAPEQVAGQKVDHRADIFALGGVFFAMLTGQSPFEAPTLGGICHKIETQPPPSLRKLGVEVPPQLESIIGRALEKDPEQRYQHVASLAEDLREVEAELEVLATAPTVIKPRSAEVPPWLRAEPEPAAGRHPRRRLVILVAAAVVLASALWAWPGSPLRSVATEEADTAGSFAGGGESPAEQSSTDAAVAEAASGEPAGAGSVDALQPSVRPGEQSSEAPGDTPAAQRDDRTAEAQQPEEDYDPLDTELEEPPPLYPASTVERAAANRIAAALIQGLERKDSVAIARLFGGSIPLRERRLLGRMLSGPQMRIRYRIGDVSSAADGLVLAPIHQTILFSGSPGTVPAPRQVEWVLVLVADETGRLHLLRIRAP
ncbi:MAG: serine/threonine protein kinase [Gemmatimonadota bacterium]|nr:MAG: serine/threonine protein kinase [Gemmatimonadota bacterium]